MSEPRSPLTTAGRSGRQRRFWPWAVAIVVLLLDQLSKLWAVQHLPFGRVLPFLPGLLQLRRVSNSGAAFSLMTGNSLALGVVSAAIGLVVAGWLLWWPPRGLWMTLAASLVLAGAVGNGLDRWRQGAVVDFLELVPIHFPIFNLADVAINAAVACFLLDAWQQRPRPRV